MYVKIYHISIHSDIILVLVVFGLCGEYSTLSCHFIACQVLIVGSDLVYQAAVWQDLDDTVGGGLYELCLLYTSDAADE